MWDSRPFRPKSNTATPAAQTLILATQTQQTHAPRRRQPECLDPLLPLPRLLPHPARVFLHPPEPPPASFASPLLALSPSRPLFPVLLPHLASSQRRSLLCLDQLHAPVRVCPRPPRRPRLSSSSLPFSSGRRSPPPSRTARPSAACPPRHRFLSTSRGRNAASKNPSVVAFPFGHLASRSSLAPLGPLPSSALGRLCLPRACASRWPLASSSPVCLQRPDLRLELSPRPAAAPPELHHGRLKPRPQCRLLLDPESPTVLLPVFPMASCPNVVFRCCPVPLSCALCAARALRIGDLPSSTTGPSSSIRRRAFPSTGSPSTPKTG